MKLIIEIDMGNDAFVEDERLEVKRILVDYMFRIQAHRNIVECSLRDINGNTVGSVKIEGKLVPGDCCPECAGMVYTMPSGDLGCKDCKWSKEDR